MEIRTPDGKTHFALNPEYVALAVPESKYESIQDLNEELLLSAEVHSSEIKEEERRVVESDFQSGNVQLVVATPTLEMGIDIGDLRSVLMIGVPPLPSNYAQRAGRAGRRLDQSDALIVTFCF